MVSARFWRALFLTMPRVIQHKLGLVFRLNRAGNILAHPFNRILWAEPHQFLGEAGAEHACASDASVAVHDDRLASA